MHMARKKETPEERRAFLERNAKIRELRRKEPKCPKCGNYGHITVTKKNDSVYARKYTFRCDCEVGVARDLAFPKWEMSMLKFYEPDFYDSASVLTGLQPESFYDKN